MAKTFYLGTTKSGAILARASTQSDYTHAATMHADHYAGKLVPMSDASFSRSAHGAIKAATRYCRDGQTAEAVELRQVDVAEYHRVTGKR